MIDPESGRTWFTVAIFIIVTSIILMFSLPRSSGGFVVSTISLITGLLLLIGLIIALRRSK